MRVFATLCVATLALWGVAAPSLGVVVYVKVCDAYGPGWAFVPGSETCVNVDTGETRKLTEDGVVFGESTLAKEAKSALEGVAIGIAMQNATVEQGKSFGAAVNVGVYGGTAAVALSGAFAAGDGLTLNAAVGYGVQEGNFAARGGLNFAW